MNKKKIVFVFFLEISGRIWFQTYSKSKINLTVLAKVQNGQLKYHCIYYKFNCLPLDESGFSPYSDAILVEGQIWAALPSMCGILTDFEPLELSFIAKKNILKFEHSLCNFSG